MARKAQLHVAARLGLQVDARRAKDESGRLTRGLRAGIIALVPALPSDWSPGQREQLEELRCTLESHPRLGGAFLFGDLVRGLSREPQTPVGLALILEEAGHPADEELTRALRMIFLSAQVEPWIVLEEELPLAAEVFPVRIFEIHRYGLHWVGPIEQLGVVPTDERLRERIEQLARKLLARRRQLVLTPQGGPTSRDDAEAASRLRVLFAAYDHLQGGVEEGLRARCAAELGMSLERIDEALDELKTTAIDETLAEFLRCIDAATGPAE